jgi:glycerol-3-phosphate dehydrogenase
MRVAVVGGGVVGAALALALARRGADTVLLEATGTLAGAASGTNSGILHTGFDSVPGELETDLILRSAALREETLGALGVPVLRCGAVMRDPPDDLPRNGVDAHRNGDGSLLVPGEWITDPVAFTRALAAAAERHGAEVRLEAPVTDRLHDFDLVANCAGLRADEVARVFGDDSFEIRPRKGEFFVFDVPLDRILLPAPTRRTKGVLVFPTLDGRCVAGPTAIDVDDKDDWSVRPEAREEVLAHAVEMHPALEGAEPVAAYAGLRPAGHGVNYLIGRSEADPRLVNVAAIRSTGVSAALGIAELVCELVLPGAEPEPLRPGPPPPSRPDWWRRA